MTMTEEPEVAAAPQRARRKVPLWVSFVIVALVAVLIAAPVSVALYVSRQHATQQAQVNLGAWWAPVSRQLESCSTAVDNVKTYLGSGTGVQVKQAGVALQRCLNDVPTTPAPNQTVALAMSSAMTALNAIAAQTIRMGELMGDKPYDQQQPDQLALFIAMSKQYSVTQITLLSLQSVVRQAGGQPTSSVPAP